MQAQYTPMACPQCGSEFVPNKNQRKVLRSGGVTFCSRRCYHDSRVTETEQRCEVCGEPFMARADNIAKGYARYCSKACSNKARAVPEADRFWALVDRRGPDECWPWTAATSDKGYGLFSRRPGNQITASRMAYVLTHGELPAGRNALHSCDNPPCCNPAHLFVGTHLDNMADRDAKERQARGERSGNAKLTAVQVREIRALYRAGWSQTAIGKRYEISQVHVGDIVSRQAWKHIE